MKTSPRLVSVNGLVLLAAMLALPAAAHDFWLQPDTFFPPSGATTTLSLLVGHGEEKQPSPLPARRITRFSAHLADGSSTDLRTLATPAFAHGASGTHLVVLATDNQAQSHLPAVRFNSYLREEGLIAAFTHRARHRLMDRDGAERYSRVAKTLIETGPPGAGSQELATTVMGLPLEIVLQRSPSLAPRPDLLPVAVFRESRPLAGALVKLTDLDRDDDTLERQLSDADGRASFMMPKPGRWLLTVVWTQHVARGDGIDYDTVFSSLSFGVRP